MLPPLCFHSVYPLTIQSLGHCGKIKFRNLLRRRVDGKAVGRSLIPDLLAERNWTQRYLAERAGVKEKALSHYVLGIRRMPLDAAVAIADALDVQPRDLYEWEPK